MTGAIMWGTVIIVVALIVFGTIIGMLRRYKRCASDQILVVYGKVKGKDGVRVAKCIHGGAAFVWPLIQDYEYMDLTPMQIDIKLKSALSNQNIRIDVPCSFTVGISIDEHVMFNAAERILGLDLEEIKALAGEIIFGQLRVVIATMDIEEINTDRDKFIKSVSTSVETELTKIGLKLINVNVQDLRDEAGYIDALGREAAAKAINEAMMKVADQERAGKIGKANADRDRDIGVAEAGRTQRVKVAEANATAVEGENTAKITIANSDANRREREAEAKKVGDAAERVQAAMAQEESYKAEQSAENARAERDRATQKADIVVPAEIAKMEMEVNADAQAEKFKREAAGKGEASYLEAEGLARGAYEMLTKQAEGFGKLVEAAGGDPNRALTYLLIEKLEEIARIQVDAIKGIRIDKVVVWDSMNGGEPTTAKFLGGMLSSLPGFHDIFRMAGMELPGYLGKVSEIDKGGIAEIQNKTTTKIQKGEITE